MTSRTRGLTLNSVVILAGCALVGAAVMAILENGSDRDSVNGQASGWLGRPRMPDMMVHLTRDSVAREDDADAPHRATRDLPGEMSADEAITSVAKSGYLASIAGGKASWVLTCAGSSIAVVAQQWEGPRFITLQGASLASLAVEDGSIHWHFRYLARRDPGVIFEELKAASAT